MLFENLASLIDGELLNEPSISSFSNIAFDAKKVKRGDLFFGSSTDVEEAISKGAYGIVSDKIKVKDFEIAWIKVKNLEESKLKLLRYLVVQENTYILNLSLIEAEITKQIQVDKNILFIDSDIQSAISALLVSSEFSVIAFTDKKLFSKLELVSLDVDIKYNITIQKATNFITTFIYKERLYKDIRFTELFLDELEFVLNFFDILEISYDIYKLGFLNHFKPLFLDRDFRILGFGQSRKVFILESDISLIKREVLFLKKKSSWANIALLLPKDIKYKEKLDIDIKYFKNYADIKKQNVSYYNFVIMLDIEDRFERYLQKTDHEINNRLF